MNSFDRKLRRLAKEEYPEIPGKFSDAVNQVLSALPEQKRRRPSFWRKPALITLQVFAVLAAAILILPNLSPGIAHALGDIPILGDFIRVITIRNYSYEDEYHKLDAQIPSVDMGGDAAAEINDDVDKLTETIISKFQEDMTSIGDSGHTYLSIDYEVVTDDQDWFTLKLQVYQGSGSSSVTYKYYHIDKSTGNIIELSDLFENDDYIDTISSYILEQMIAEMEEDPQKSYWVDSQYEDWNFSTISPDQNFYFNSSGEMVIVFDEYEVAPGYMGTPEFAIPFITRDSLGI